MSFDWLIFDLDDTLFDFNAAESHALNSLLSALGHDPVSDVLQKYHDINRVVWAEYERGGLTAEQVKVGRFERLFSELGINEDASFWSNQYLDFLSRGSELFEGAKECLVSLSGLAQMGIITNGLSRVQKPRLMKAGIDGYFSFLVISEQAKSAKPHEDIFKIAHGHTHFVDKEKVLMIGDRLETDVKGANDFGFKSCWLNASQQENTTEIKPDMEIQKLSDLLRLYQ